MEHSNWKHPLAQPSIIHIDRDCLYAQVEEQQRPELKGKPFAVGGSVDIDTKPSLMKFARFFIK